MIQDKIDFICPCPNRHCNHCEIYSPNKVIKWKHTLNCDLGEWLDKYGNIICKNCGFSFFILDSTLDCKNGLNDKSNRIPDYDKLVSIIGALISNPGVDESDILFLMSVSERIKQKAKELELI